MNIVTPEELRAALATKSAANCEIARLKALMAPFQDALERANEVDRRAAKRLEALRWAQWHLSRGAKVAAYRDDFATVERGIMRHRGSSYSVPGSRVRAVEGGWTDGRDTYRVAVALEIEAEIAAFVGVK